MHVAQEGIAASKEEWMAWEGSGSGRRPVERRSKENSSMRPARRTSHSRGANIGPLSWGAGLEIERAGMELPSIQASAGGGAVNSLAGTATKGLSHGMQTVTVLLQDQVAEKLGEFASRGVFGTQDDIVNHAITEELRRLEGEMKDFVREVDDRT